MTPRPVIRCRCRRRRPGTAWLFGAALCVLAATAATVTPAATVKTLRLASVSKSDAVLALDLTEAAPASVDWGESPGDWSGHADATSAVDHHELTMTGLSPSTRYFYRVSVDGTPSDDMLTFESGRSWVTRQAVILVTADVPGGGSAGNDEAKLAEKLFGEEADALIVLGGDGGKPDDFARLHARSMTEKVVVAAAPGADTHLSVADVRVVSTGALPGTDDGTCWRVALGDSAPPGAEVAVTVGPKPSVTVVGDVVKVVLADPDVSPGARAYVRLDFADGHLTATLRDVDGGTLGTAALARTCKAPKPKEKPAASGDDGEAGETSDAEADSSDCDAH